MNKNDFLKLFLIIFIVILSPLISHANASSIIWNEYSDAAFIKAKNQHRLVLLFIKSGSCRWCNQEEKTTFTNNNVAKLINKNFLPIRVDVDKQLNIAKQYHISDLPAVLILDANYKVINTISGYLPAEDMIKNLKASIPQ